MRALPGWCVIEVEEKKQEKGLYIPESATTELQRGRVVEVGDEYWKDNKYHQPSITQGQRVVFKKYYDNDLEIEGKKYKIVHLDNIQVILD